MAHRLVYDLLALCAFFSASHSLPFFIPIPFFFFSLSPSLFVSVSLSLACSSSLLSLFKMSLVSHLV
jgi:hypothetical protein